MTLGRTSGSPLRLDLTDFASQSIELIARSRFGGPARHAWRIWGSPVVRHGGALPRRAETSQARAALPDSGTSVPQGVILILADTLRRDHLDAYGYSRPTAPVLARLASEGALFKDNISQATWTKPSVPSILSSLYASTHGVAGIHDLLPASAVTLTEAFRDAGYATFHAASHPWAATPSRLQQGVEVLHNGSSLPPASGYHVGQTARPFVTRFLAWLDGHDDVPYFALLHFFDSHGPHNPYPPYDTLWAAPSAGAEHDEWKQKLEEAGVMMRISVSGWAGARLAAAPSELDQIEELADRPTAVALQQEAGVDAEAYLAHERSGLDGEIRAMDVEIGRLLEGLEARGLGGKTLVAFISDHGDELLDHGRYGHGHSAYGELLNVPLLVWWPGVVPEETVIEETVESIDLMPTLLDLSGIATPGGAQGQSLVPFLASPDAPSSFGWEPRGAFSEKTFGGIGAEYASSLVLDGWKLIHNSEPLKGRPEYELYDHRTDPLNLHDVAGDHPDIVERLGKELTLRRERAVAARVPPDGAPAESISSEDVRRLRALGYIR